jgi:hypothetical protein
MSQNVISEWEESLIQLETILCLFATMKTLPRSNLTPDRLFPDNRVETGERTQSQIHFNECRKYQQ